MMEHRPAKVRTVLRWVAFLPVALLVDLVVVASTGSFLLQLSFSGTGFPAIEWFLFLVWTTGSFPAIEWFLFLVWTTGSATAVCVGAWTAPSHRGLASLLAAVVPCLLPWALELPAIWVEFVDPRLFFISLVTGLVLGLILVLWDKSVVRTVLRWVAVLPVVLTLDFLAYVLSHRIFSDLVHTLPGKDALAVLLWGTSAIVGVYAATRVVPTARRFAGVLAGLALCWKIPLTLTGHLNADTLFLPAGLAWGVIFGLALIWRDGAPKTSLIDEASPRRYRGTAPFQDSAVDRKTFFGREAEGRSLLNLVLAERLVVLFAKSGMGKSSLLNTDLSESLRRLGYLPLFVRLGDPEKEPLQLLFDGVRQAAREAGMELVGGDTASAWHYFTNTEFWSPQNDLLRPVLILDQFEELFTLHPPEPRQRFIRQLAELVRNRGATGSLKDEEPATMEPAPNLKIVLALREDFLAELEELARPIPGILHHRFRLGPLSPGAARRAIVEPAAVQDADFATLPFRYREEAVDRILSFLASHRKGMETVTGDAVEPTQLQLVCQYLEELARSRQVGAGSTVEVEIVVRDLQDEDRLRQVLEDFYDRTLAAVHPARLRRKLRRLCEQRLISSAGRRLTEDEEEILNRHKIPRDLLRLMVDARLLRPEPRLGGVFYELSHDTMVDPIRRSQKRRLIRKRRVVVVTAAYLLIASAAWWLVTGREEARWQQERLISQQLLSPIPDPDDPVAVEALARARLDFIEDNYEHWAGSFRVFGAVATSLLEVELRYPTLRQETRTLSQDVANSFLRAQSLKSPTKEEDERLNQRVFIEGGTFLMGTPERLGEDDERPVHEVSVSRFYVQQHEVTNGEYRRFDPLHRPTAPEDHPVVGVTWWEAAAYAAWIDGRLPTEAEWEFVARADTDTLWFFGDHPAPLESYAWIYSNSRRSAHPVCSTPEKHPNGLCDLYGNAWEWVADWYGPYSEAKRQDPLGPRSGEFRVIRGGSIWELEHRARSASRYGSRPSDRKAPLGFRVVFPVASSPGQEILDH